MSGRGSRRLDLELEAPADDMRIVLVLGGEAGPLDRLSVPGEQTSVEKNFRRPLQRSDPLLRL